MPSDIVEDWQSMPVPTPYVFGFALTPDQLRTVVHKWLPDHTADESRGDRSYHIALVQYFRKQRLEWTVLNTSTSSGERRFLWVIDVIPIWKWDGTVPEVRMPAKNIEQVQSKFGLESVETMGQIWPFGMTPPEWLIRKIIEKGKQICEKRRTEGNKA
ncbi:hypothetical protein K438DRAFT_1217645 [Mycena galopus ATCC 62051]|nr:hypothetical protein K438DRAFT_1217645 [Mycena galopus ATCC 62051]